MEKAGKHAAACSAVEPTGLFREHSGAKRYRISTKRGRGRGWPLQHMATGEDLEVVDSFVHLFRKHGLQEGGGGELFR